MMWLIGSAVVLGGGVNPLLAANVWCGYRELLEDEGVLMVSIDGVVLILSVDGVVFVTFLISRTGTSFLFFF